MILISRLTPPERRTSDMPSTLSRRLATVLSTYQLNSSSDMSLVSAE